MTRPSKKKKRKAKSPAANGGGGGGGGGGGEEAENPPKVVDESILGCLNGDFSSLSLEREKGMEELFWGNGRCPSTSASSSSYFDSSTGDEPSTSSSSSERFLDADLIEMQKGFGGMKQKKTSVSTGTVSSVIGKDYVRSSPSGGGRKYNNFYNLKGRRVSNEEAKQFLCSMLGEECELSLAIVQDVLCQCGYDVEKALDTLLELSASSHKQFKDDSQPQDRMSDLSVRSYEKDFQHIMQSSGREWRAYSDVLMNSTKESMPNPEITKECLPQKVLESLFNVPKNSEQEPSNMNWKNIVKKMDSFGQRINVNADGAAELQHKTEWAKGEEYAGFRRTASQHYDAMKSYYQKAATAYSSGNKGYAAYLSEQGQVHNKIAREADEKASQEIFEARNKGMQNVVTIDLHGQHVKQAVRLLKVHLLMFTTYIPSVHFLRVITGCGAHGFGRGKLKQSVIAIIEMAEMEWTEENRGTVLVKLDGRRDLSFMVTEGDSD